MRSLLTLLAINAVATAAAPVESEMVQLERRYLECDRMASTQLLPMGDAIACSMNAERLLSQRFGGDFERLLQWWRSARATTSRPELKPSEHARATDAAAATASQQEPELVVRDTRDAGSSPFDTAQALYQAGRYAEAYELFARLADCGHRQAARIALQMHGFGSRLYGLDFAARPQQLVRWQVAMSGDPQGGSGGCSAA